MSLSQPASTSLIATLLTCFGVSSTIVLHASVSVADTPYSIQPLPFLPSDINDRAQVVGGQYLWDQGTVLDLRSLPGSNNSPLAARAINNSGFILGDGLTVNTSTTYLPTIPNQAFISDGKTVSDLGVVSKGFCIESCAPMKAVDLNDRGQLLYGFEYLGYDPFVNSYVQNSNGSRSNVFNYPATAINQAGEVTGYTFPKGRSGPGVGVFADSNRTNSAIALKSPGFCSPFSTSSGSRCFSAEIVATALNDKGQVVGAGPLTSDFSAPIHALLWSDPSGNPVGQDLGTLKGGTSLPFSSFGFNTASVANSINNDGLIAGYAYTPNGERHAVIWKDGALVDLNDLVPINAGWTLSSAVKVNNEGQLVGTGLMDGQEEGFLLTPEPVPEPDSGIALIAGFSTLLAIAGWKHRSPRSKSQS
jgi:probable HAF family extracellular repeat protein